MIVCGGKRCHVVSYNLSFYPDSDKVLLLLTKYETSAYHVVVKILCK